MICAHLLVKTKENHILLSSLQVILHKQCTTMVVPKNTTWNYKGNLEKMQI